MTLNIQDSSFRLAGARGTLSFLLPFVTFGTAGNAVPQEEEAMKSIITLATAVFKFFLSFPADIYFTSTQAPVRTVTAQSEDTMGGRAIGGHNTDCCYQSVAFQVSVFRA